MRNIQTPVKRIQNSENGYKTKMSDKGYIFECYPRPMRALPDLAGIGRAMLRDFDLLGIKSIQDLAQQDGHHLYLELQRLTGSRQDPCVLDLFRCAIAQAKKPDLPLEQRNWWYWSRLRKAGKC